MMNCEEFELRGLDAERSDVDALEAAAADGHARVCARCYALRESWREVKTGLRLLREETRLDSAPARVEMRLKQELRTRREARIPRNAVAIAGWGLAAAAVLVASLGWVRTHEPFTKRDGAGNVAPVLLGSSAGTSAAQSSDNLLAADFDSGEFTELPLSLPGAPGDQAVWQVRMQREALGRFGLPVEPERASEWVDVDFLVGEDGQPQAVRLHQDERAAAVKQ